MPIFSSFFISDDGSIQIVFEELIYLRNQLAMIFSMTFLTCFIFIFAFQRLVRNHNTLSTIKKFKKHQKKWILSLRSIEERLNYVELPRLANLRTELEYYLISSNTSSSSCCSFFDEDEDLQQRHEETEGSQRDGHHRFKYNNEEHYEHQDEENGTNITTTSTSTTTASDSFHLGLSSFDLSHYPSNPLYNGLKNRNHLYATASSSVKMMKMMLLNKKSNYTLPLNSNHHNLKKQHPYRHHLVGTLSKPSTKQQISNNSLKDDLQEFSDHRRQHQGTKSISSSTNMTITVENSTMKNKPSSSENKHVKLYSQLNQVKDVLLLLTDRLDQVKLSNSWLSTNIDSSNNTSNYNSNALQDQQKHLFYVKSSSRRMSSSSSCPSKFLIPCTNSNSSNNRKDGYQHEPDLILNKSRFPSSYSVLNWIMAYLDTDVLDRSTVKMVQEGIHTLESKKSLLLNLIFECRQELEQLKEQFEKFSLERKWKSYSNQYRYYDPSASNTTTSSYSLYKKASAVHANTVPNHLQSMKRTMNSK